jgi:hypothetical protein
VSKSKENQERRTKHDLPPTWIATKIRNEREKEEPKFSSPLENNGNRRWEEERGVEQTFPFAWKTTDARNEKEKDELSGRQEGKEELSLIRNGGMQQEGMKGKRKGMGQWV